MTESTSVQPVRIRVVQSCSEFASLAHDWESLQKDAISTSVFQTFDWQCIWWTTYGRDQPLRLLLATKSDRLVGILPLYIQTVPTLWVAVRILRPVGIGGDTMPDDLGPVLATGCENEVAQALASAIMQLPGWDVLQLSDMLPACAFTAAIRAEIGRQGLTLLTGRSARITFLDLPSTWEGWLEKLSRDRRWRIRNSRRKLCATHATRFLVWSDPDTLDAAVDRLVFLHNQRWNATGEVHGFATPEYIGFHRAVMHACLRRNRLRLYCLEVDGQIVAMYYGYHFRNRVYLMQTGFHPGFSKLQPGQVLLHYIIENAIGEGLTVVDFLRGDHRYKDKLATGERETVYVTAFRWTLGALAHGIRRMVMPAVRARAMKVLQKNHLLPMENA